MTLDEAISHAQAETARADRERARRIAAEERHAALRADARAIAAWREHCEDVKSDTMRIAVGAALDHFFDGVREVMREQFSNPHVPQVQHLAFLANTVSRLTRELDEAVIDRDEALREAARMREANDVLDAKVTELREQLTMRREIQTMAVDASKEAVAKMNEAVADRDRWSARNRELEERIAKIREVCR